MARFLRHNTMSSIAQRSFAMFATSHRMPYGPGAMTPWFHGGSGQDMSHLAQRGREAIMHRMTDLERMLEENATTVCVTGFLLGTFVDKRFYLLPLAVGGMMLWRSMNR